MTRLPNIWEEPMRMVSNMGKLFDSLGEDFTFGSGYGRTDIYEKDGELYYEVELPGLKKENISARIENDSLVISGEIKRKEEINKDDYLRMERRYGRFQKRFLLPEEVEKTSDPKASFKDGVLTVSLPLNKSIRGEVIDINIE